VFARIRAEFVDRDATLEETGGKEEAERRRPKGNGKSSDECRLALTKPAGCPLSAALDGKRVFLTA
jgi:hypothetical protein